MCSDHAFLIDVVDRELDRLSDVCAVLYTPTTVLLCGRLDVML